MARGMYPNECPPFGQLRFDSGPVDSHKARWGAREGSKHERIGCIRRPAGLVRAGRAGGVPDNARVGSGADGNEALDRRERDPDAGPADRGGPAVRGGALLLHPAAPASEALGESPEGGIGPVTWPTPET